MTPQYSIKRIFTLSTFTASVRDLFAHTDALHAALTHQRVSQAFVEKIMLAVTQVNGCRYCSYAHTRMALKAGVSETELRELVAGEFNQLPAEEIMALTFAQHYAEQDGRYAATAWQRLEAAYGLDAARDVLVYIRLISLANLYGNTFDALLERIGGRPVAGSHFLDELAVLIWGATGVPIGILITRVSPRTARFIFTRKDSRMSHA
jgi:AhpD family alkylhydroperoxidase